MGCVAPGGKKEKNGYYYCHHHHHHHHSLSSAFSFFITVCPKYTVDWYCVLILLILKIKLLWDVMPYLTVNNKGIFIRRVKQRRPEPADELPLPHTPAWHAERQLCLFLPLHNLGTVNILSLHLLSKLPVPEGRAGGVREPSDSEVSRKFLCEKCNFYHYFFLLLYRAFW